MKLFIKNMVCIRCKMIVRSELEKVGLSHEIIELGEVELLGTVTVEQLTRLDAGLKRYGLELMGDKKRVLVERIKTAVIELVHYMDDQPHENLSIYLSKRLNHDYTYLSNLFSQVLGTTIEKFYINHKIERVKEMLVYDELSLTEIAYRMNYSSVAHLSNQFKRVTGLNATYFKQLRHKRRKNLEDL